MSSVISCVEVEIRKSFLSAHCTWWQQCFCHVIIDNEHVLVNTADYNEL